ncbi:MAG: DNA polymerase III subunit delta [Myxococcota bacterium]
MAKPNPRTLAVQFFKELKKKGAPEPIYYLHGEEAYLLDNALRALLEAAAPHGLNDSNYEQLPSKELTSERLRNAVETSSFFGGRRVVVVRDLQEMDLKQLDELADYFDAPNPNTCLVLHAMTAQRKIDGRKGIIKRLKKAARVVEFKAYYAEDAERFARNRAEKRGLELDRHALAYFMDAVGIRLVDIVGALEKLDLFLGHSDSTRHVRVEQVQEIIADTRSHDVFDLTDALGEKRMEDALRVLDKMLIAGESAIGITTMIARHFRILAKLQDPGLRVASNKEKAQAAGVHPYFLKSYVRQVQKFSVSSTEDILSALLRVDFSLKSSTLDDRIILERLLFDISLAH